MQQYIFTFSIGLLAAAVIFSVWWLTLAAGVMALMMRRSYSLLFLGIIFDLWFGMWHGVFFFGFYTIIFAFTTFVAERVKRRLTSA